MVKKNTLRESQYYPYLIHNNKVTLNKTWNNHDIYYIFYYKLIKQKTYIFSIKTPYPTNFVCVPSATTTLSCFLTNETFKNARVRPSFTVSALIITQSPIFAEAK